jgi:hypothetical protein
MVRKYLKCDKYWSIVWIFEMTANFSYSIFKKNQSFINIFSFWATFNSFVNARYNDISVDCNDFEAVCKYHWSYCHWALYCNLTMVMIRKYLKGDKYWSIVWIVWSIVFNSFVNARYSDISVDCNAFEAGFLITYRQI